MHFTQIKLSIHLYFFYFLEIRQVFKYNHLQLQKYINNFAIWGTFKCTHPESLKILILAKWIWDSIRTKLKQTEVDCEYLKRCCESLTEENRRLHRELQDLKAQKSPHNPFHLHGPAATITMCPSCERLTTTTMRSTTTATGNNITSKMGTFGVNVPKSRFYPFAQRTYAAS